jgi:hypothetical protein
MISLKENNSKKIINEFCYEVNDFFKKFKEFNTITLLDYSFETLMLNDSHKILSLFFKPKVIDSIDESNVKKYTDNYSYFIDSLIKDNKYHSTTKINKQNIAHCEQIKNYNTSHEIVYYENRGNIDVSDIIFSEEEINKHNFIREDYSDWFDKCKDFEGEIGNFCTVVGFKTKYTTSFIFLYTVSEIEESHFQYIIDLNSLLALNMAKLVDYSNLIEIRQKAIKSTLASIVARGLSHTDGSHSMIYFERFFTKHIEQDNLTPKVRTKLVELFRNYNMHLKNVMELTADISGGLGNQSSFSYSLKEIVHYIKDKHFPSSSLNQENNEYLSFEDFIKSNDKGIYKGTFLFKSIVDDKKPCCIDYRTINNSEDLIVSIPGGENGKTAIIQILKNIYRNIFKHNLTATEDIIKLKLTVTEADDYITFNFIEQFKTSDDNFKSLINALNKKIITDGNEIESSSWGLKEMKICAAYLKGVDIENNIDELEECYKIKRNKKGFLVHSLFLKKPKDFILLSDENDKVELPKNGTNLYLEKYNANELPKNVVYIINNKFIDLEKSKSRNYRFLNYEDLIFKKDYSLENLQKSWLKKHFKINSFESYTEQTQIFSVLGGFQNKEIKKFNYFIDESHSLGLYELSGLERDSKTVKKEVIDNLDYYEAIKGVYSESDIVECINTKIAVLDERLQKNLVIDDDRIENKYVKYLETDSVKEKVYQSYFLEKKGIHIPKKENNLGFVFYGEDNNKNDVPSDDRFDRFVEILEKCFEEAEYVIVHSSGLEGLAKKLSKERFGEIKQNVLPNSDVSQEDGGFDIVTTYLIKHILKLRSKCKYLILTSGKGNPSTLPNHSYYINYNNLVEIITNASKRKLINVLSTVRQIENNLI